MVYAFSSFLANYSEFISKDMCLYNLRIAIACIFILSSMTEPIISLDDLQT